MVSLLPKIYVVRQRFFYGGKCRSMEKVFCVQPKTSLIQQNENVFYNVTYSTNHHIKTLFLYYISCQNPLDIRYDKATANLRYWILFNGVSFFVKFLLLNNVPSSLLDLFCVSNGFEFSIFLIS